MRSLEIPTLPFPFPSCAFAVVLRDCAESAIQDNLYFYFYINIYIFLLSYFAPNRLGNSEWRFTFLGSSFLEDLSIADFPATLLPSKSSQNISIYMNMNMNINYIYYLFRERSEDSWEVGLEQRARSLRLEQSLWDSSRSPFPHDSLSSPLFALPLYNDFKYYYKYFTLIINIVLCLWFRSLGWEESVSPRNPSPGTHLHEDLIDIWDDIYSFVIFVWDVEEGPKKERVPMKDSPSNRERSLKRSLEWENEAQVHTAPSSSPVRPPPSSSSFAILIISSSPTLAVLRSDFVIISASNLIPNSFRSRARYSLRTPSS